MKNDSGLPYPLSQKQKMMKNSNNRDRSNYTEMSKTFKKLCLQT